MEPGAIGFDERGLVTVVVQDRITGEIRMVAHANADAVRRTVERGEGWFWSRSRAALWKKGETSGNVLAVEAVFADCDRDAVVYLVDPHGPSCHTGADSCFFERMSGRGARAMPFLMVLEKTLAARVEESTGAESYTRSLIDQGAAKIGAKIEEEAAELARAIEGQDAARVVSECADLLYHAMVGLLHRKVPVRSVLAELARRLGTSGHDEKASRPSA
jgi:phosphoribosyl-ATP pyrophosphohydrolase/phosphoribosyl-AMP cyclohydrolase